MKAAAACMDVSEIVQQLRYLTRNSRLEEIRMAADEDNLMLMAHVERRSMERQLLSAPVFLHKYESASDVSELRDVNRKGAFFYTNVAVATGGELLLLLLVPAEGFVVPIFCTAQAVRIEIGEGYFYGVAVTFREVKMLDICKANHEHAAPQAPSITNDSSQEVTAYLAVLDR